VVIAGRSDAAIFHNYRAVPSRAQRSKFRRVDENSAEGKEMLFHEAPRSRRTKPPISGNQSRSPIALAVHRSGQRTLGETTNTEKRAAARIALTCIFGQRLKRRVQQISEKLRYK